MKKALQEKTILSIMVTFLIIAIKANTIDITTQFQQVIKETLPEGFRVECSRYETRNGSKTLRIKSSQGETASFVGYSTTIDDANKSYQSIALIETKPAFERKGFASVLLKYVKSQCTGNCLGTGVHAYNPENETPEYYASIKKFYTKNGGECYEEEMTPKGPVSGYFNFPPNQ